MLNQDALKRIAAKHGVVGKAAIARHIGVDTVTLWRAGNGTAPSNTFMARLVIAFPGVPLKDLLTLEVPK